MVQDKDSLRHIELRNWTTILTKGVRNEGNTEDIAG